MKPKSAVAKGKILEKAIESDLRQTGIDPHARRNPGSGSGLLKGDIYSPKTGISFECKNTKNIGMAAWKQALNDAKRGHNTPILIWKPPYSSTEDCLCIIEWHVLKTLLKLAYKDIDKI
jgi:hypothetical protein